MNILIAAGGTGGHLYPAIAVARELLDRDWETGILFVTTEKGKGVEILEREEFEYKTISAGGMKRKSLVEMLTAFLKLPVGLVQALFHLKFFGPDVVMGAGGYVSGPVLTAAWLLRIPRLIHEQNVLPGMTNKLLAKIVGNVAVAFPESTAYFPGARVEITGNPVRKEFFDLKPKVKEVEYKDLFTVLVFGGSQGAHSINTAMLEAAPILKKKHHHFRILHQTGETDCQWVKEIYKKLDISAEVLPFIFDMFDAFRLADLVVCRAGAMTVSELAAAGKPALLIPLPTAADNHQEINARFLEKNNAAEVILEDEFLGETLAEKIEYYMNNPLALMVVGREAKKMSEFKAAVKIATMAEKLKDGNYPGRVGKTENKN